MLIADSAILLSIYKPILFLAFVCLWGYAVAWLDKDLRMFHMPRQMWNGIFIGVGVLSLFLWLVIPFFWLGVLLVVLLNIGTFVGFHFYRNTKVPDERQWNISLDPFRTKLEAYQHAQAQKAASVRLMDKSGKPIDVPLQNDPLAPVHAVFAQLMEFSIPRGASRIDVVTDATQTTLVAHIDGVPYPQPNIEPAQGLALTDYLKHHAGLDIQDRRRKQKGSLKVDADVLGKHKLQLTTSGNNRGVAMAIEINPGGLSDRKIADLGLTPTQLAQLKPVLEQNTMAVLATAPAGQGLTTTLYTLAGTHDPYTQQIIAMDDNFEIELEGVNNEPIKTSADAPPLAQQINTIMLREPQILLLGQLTDPDSAKILAKFTQETRMYLGLRQADSMLALRAWIQAVGDAKLASNGVAAVINQRLIRSVCPTCRLAYTPDANMLKKLNLPADQATQFFKHSGQVLVKNEPQVCPNCHGIGYKGRIAVFEVMVLDDEARALAGAGQFDQLRTHLRKNRMMLLQEAALQKVVEGRTTISEITRVLGNK
mgnify:CR=1 FL=1